MSYRVKLQCCTCGHVWKATLKSLDDPDPKCPNLACSEAVLTRGMDFNSTRAPAAIGMSNAVRAVDETAKIVMDTYQMTDLRSDVRPGETMAPKLAPHLQKQADSVFGGAKRGNPLLPRNAGRLARNALAGAYRPGVGGTPDVIGQLHDARIKPKINIIASDSPKR